MELMLYAKSISWIDDCRIPFVDETEDTKRSVSGHQKVYGSGEEIYYKLKIENQQDRNKGRFPANILVSDNMLNDGTTTIGSGHKIPKRTNNSKNIFDLKTYHREAAYEDKGTNSRYYNIDKWFENLLEL